MSYPARAEGLVNRIGTNGERERERERESGKSVLSAWLYDDETLTLGRYLLTCKPKKNIVWSWWLLQIGKIDF